MCVETPTRWWDISQRFNIRVWSGWQEKQGKSSHGRKRGVVHSQVSEGICLTLKEDGTLLLTKICSSASLTLIWSLIWGLHVISSGITGPHLNSVSLLPDLLPKPVPVGQAFPGPQDIILWCGALPVLCYDRSGQHWLSPDWILFQGQQDLEIKKLMGRTGWLMLAVGPQEEAVLGAMMTALSWKQRKSVSNIA